MVWFNTIKYKYIKEIYFIVLFLAQKFVLSMIVRIFAASVLAKPLNNAQIVRGVFCLYTFEHGESYPNSSLKFEIKAKQFYAASQRVLW